MNSFLRYNICARLFATRTWRNVCRLTNTEEKVYLLFIFIIHLCIYCSFKMLFLLIKKISKQKQLFTIFKVMTIMIILLVKMHVYVVLFMYLSYYCINWSILTTYSMPNRHFHFKLYHKIILLD